MVGAPCPHGMDCDHVGAGRLNKAGEPISIDDAECAGGCEEHYLFCKCEVVA